MRSVSRIGLVTLALGAISCRRPPASAPAEASAAPELIYTVSPARLLPDIVGPRGVVASEGGQRRVLVDRMRLLVREDGSMDRAAEILPVGDVKQVALPPRLGGGFLFHVNAGGGTEIWRAASWLGKLEPLARRNEAVSEIVPGFDRLYVRLTTNNRVVAIDARTGEPMGIAPLPPSATYGAMVFADAWRAIVETDLRGPLATFDAGRSWRPIGLGEKASGVAVLDGDPAVLVAGGREAWVVDARGLVQKRSDVRARRDEPAGGRPPPGPFGKRALRAAVEDGWPDTATTAVVARAGALARVSLRDGSVVAMAEEAYPERLSTCHAARLGLRGIGFVCGEREGPTVIYEYRPPLAMIEVLRFDKPRFVSPSGNGALVVRGPCGDDPGREGEARAYCVRSPTGQLREIQVKGDFGAERVVGLGDGRVAVLVPPRAGDAGLIRVLSGPSLSSSTGGTLTLPDEPAAAARELRRGMWLDGFEERQPGVLGGWVEAGGAILGLQVGLDGKVEIGPLKEDATRAIFGGRFAIALGDGARAEQTSDGGLSWSPFDLPGREDEARALPTRGCGPVGCALPGWVRVGWGDPEGKDDLKPAPAPAVPYVPLKASSPLAFSCNLDTTATPPLPDAPLKPAPARQTSKKGGPTARAGHETPTGWAQFRNVAPPGLADGDVGLDNGAPYDVVSLRAYAWGKRGTDWTRTGRWLVRFDDRFDPRGGVRSSAPTASPWPDEATATEGIGAGNSSWSAFLDPAGHAALVTRCSNGPCAFFSVADGQPVLPLREAAGHAGLLQRPYAHSAVHLGESWFFLSQSPSHDGVSLWRADLGVARLVTTYFRPSTNRYDTPRLVRRALGTGLGILVAGAAEPGERAGTWYVLPINPESGELGEPVSLGRRDLAGVTLARCGPQQDGWAYDGGLETAPSIDVENARGQLDAIELRLRLDPGAACIESMATKSGPFHALAPPGPLRIGPPAQINGKLKGGRVSQPPPGPKPLSSAPAKKGAGDPASAFPLSVTERSTGRRWGLSCHVKPRSK